MHTPQSPYLYAALRVASHQRFREGVGGRGLATYSENRSPELCSLSPKAKGGIGKGAQRRGLNLWHSKDLLAPTPSACQPLFETSDSQWTDVVQSLMIFGCGTPSLFKMIAGRKVLVLKNVGALTGKLCSSPRGSYRNTFSTESVFTVPQKGIGKNEKKRLPKSDRKREKGLPKSDRKNCEWPTPFRPNPFCGTIDFQGPVRAATGLPPSPGKGAPNERRLLPKQISVESFSGQSKLL